MKKANPPSLIAIDELARAAQDAYKHGHSLECAIISFQAIEFLLKLTIREQGRSRGVSESNLRVAADRVISFRRLVLHLDLIYPQNGLGDRLLSLNRQRNTLMHRLLDDFQSIQDVHQQARALCLEGLEVYDDLRGLLVGPRVQVAADDPRLA